MYPATQPLPGFTTEQTASLQACISAQIAANNKVLLDQMTVLINKAFDKHFGPLPPLQQQHSTQQATQATQQAIPPAPQAKKEEVKETRPQPLYQATVEDAEDDDEEIAESTKHGNSMLTGSKSHDSMQFSRKWTPHTGFLATCLATFLTSFFDSTSFLALLLASHFGYIRCMEEMEASGEG